MDSSCTSEMEEEEGPAQERADRLPGTAYSSEGNLTFETNDYKQSVYSLCFTYTPDNFSESRRLGLDMVCLSTRDSGGRSGEKTPARMCELLRRDIEIYNIRGLI